MRIKSDRNPRCTCGTLNQNTTQKEKKGGSMIEYGLLASQTASGIFYTLSSQLISLWNSTPLSVLIVIVAIIVVGLYFWKK
jgi:hypothetical protein